MFMEYNLCLLCDVYAPCAAGAEHVYDDVYNVGAPMDSYRFLWIPMYSYGFLEDSLWIILMDFYGFP